MKTDKLEIDFGETWTQTLLRVGLIQSVFCLSLALIFKSAFLAVLGLAIFLVKRGTWKANAVALLIFLALIYAAKLMLVAWGVMLGYLIFRFS